LTELGVYSGPTEIVLKDRAMLLAIVLWAICALVIAYQNVLFGPRGLSGFMAELPIANFQLPICSWLHSSFFQSAIGNWQSAICLGHW
ncbi:MAG: hypothetical protein AAB363_00790, partial [Planctomycetota bacterium]